VKLAAESGLNMRFIRGKEAGRIRSAKLSESLIEYRDLRYVTASNAGGHEMMFGARFFARVYLDLVRPTSLLVTAGELIEPAQKNGLAQARSVAYLGPVTKSTAEMCGNEDAHCCKWASRRLAI
jgi:hypothetical protein